MKDYIINCRNFIDFQFDLVNYSDIEISFSNCVFDSTYFHDCNFTNVKFFNCEFRYSNFVKSNFSNCIFDSCIFENSNKIIDSNFSNSKFINSICESFEKDFVNVEFLDRGPQDYANDDIVGCSFSSFNKRLEYLDLNKHSLK
jgi:uncharacterized protein YjbI with pentapeptide repeats